MLDDVKLEDVRDVKELLKAIQDCSVKNEKFGIILPPSKYQQLSVICTPRESDSDIVKEIRENCQDELAFLEASLVIDVCKSVVAYVKAHAPYELASKLDAPCDTRWNSNEPMLQSVKDNYNAVRNIPSADLLWSP